MIKKDKSDLVKRRLKQGSEEKLVLNPWVKRVGQVTLTTTILCLGACQLVLAAEANEESNKPKIAREERVGNHSASEELAPSGREDPVSNEPVEGNGSQAGIGNENAEVLKDRRNDGLSDENKPAKESDAHASSEKRENSGGVALSDKEKKDPNGDLPITDKVYPSSQDDEKDKGEESNERRDKVDKVSRPTLSQPVNDRENLLERHEGSSLDRSPLPSSVLTALRSDPSQQVDTVVELKTEGFGDKPFDWNLLPDKKVTVKFRYTKTDPAIVDFQQTLEFTKEGTKSTYVGWPTVGIEAASVYAEIGTRRVQFISSSSTGQDGKLTFKVTLRELPDITTTFEVRYQDAYGKDLESSDLPSETDTMPKFKVKIKEKCELTLPNKNVDFDLQNDDDLEEQGLFSVDEIVSITDTINEVDLRNPSNVTEVTIDGKKEGDLTIGDKLYHYLISYDPNDGHIRILLTYRPKCLIPEKDDQDKLPAPPQGYKRVSFNAKGETLGKKKVDGEFKEGESLRVLDIRADLKWTDSDLQEAIKDLFDEDLPAIYKNKDQEKKVDTTYKFNKWNEDISKKDEAVDTKEFHAIYEEKAYVLTEEPKIANGSGQNVTDSDYVKVTFDPTGKGSIGSSNDSSALTYWVLKDRTWDQIKGYKKDPSDEKPVFVIPTPKWDASHDGVDRNFLAWKENGQQYLYQNGQHALATTLTGQVNGDRTFTARFKADDFVYYTPKNADQATSSTDQNVPTEDASGNEIDKEDYHIIAFKVEDGTKATLNKGDVIDKKKKATVISVLVRKGTKWKKDIYPNVEVEKDYKLWYWQDSQGKVWTAEEDGEIANGEVLTAYLIKNGQDISKEDLSKHPLPQDQVYKLTLQKDDKSIADDNSDSNQSQYNKTYAIFKGSSLSQAGITLTAPKAKEGFKDPKWYKGQEETGKEDISSETINQDTVFKASATAQTTAERLQEKSALVAKTIAVFKNDAITWKDGLSLNEGLTQDEKAAVEQALKDATVTDVTNPARTSNGKGEFKGTLKVTFKDGSSLSIDNQFLLVYENGTTYPEAGKVIPKDGVKVTFSRDEDSVEEEGFTNLKPILVKKGTTVPENKFPQAKVKAGYKNMTWAPEKAKEVDQDQEFKASATAKTTAERLQEKSALVAKTIVVFKGDTITWKDGLGLKDGLTKEEKAAVEEALKDATVTDATNPARTSGKEGEFKGTLKVTFKDGSSLSIDKQTLLVYENGTTYPEDGKVIPKDGVKVTFSRDDKSVEAEGFENISPLLVKKGTAIPSDKFPQAKAKSGYKNLTWAPEKAKEVDQDTVFKASATAQTTAERLQEKSALVAKTIAVFKGDDITWKDGLGLKEGLTDEDQKAVEQALKDATVTDVTDPARTSNGKGEFKGTLKVTFADKSVLEIKEQTLLVYENGTPYPEAGKVIPKDGVKVTFSRDDASVAEEGFTNITPLLVKKGTAVPSDKFPQAKAKAGYKNLTWTPDKDQKVDQDKEFKASATAKTTAERLQEKSALVAKTIAVFKNDAITWKDGLGLKEGLTEEEKVAVEKALKDATVTDATSPTRTSNAKGEFKGTLKVTFADKSVLEIKDQTLLVYENKQEITTENKDKPKPSNSVLVEYKKGEGIQALEPDNKQILVKIGTSLEKTDFPATRLSEGYEGPVQWTGNGDNEGLTVSKTNNIFTAKATKKAPLPPKPDDGEKPTPPKPGDGDKPTPPKPDDGEKPTPPKPDDGDKPTPPKPDDGDKPTPPKPDDEGEKPTPPKPDDGGKPTPPKPDDGGKPTPPKPDDEGDKPTPPKPGDGDKPTPPKPDDGEKPTPPKPDDGDKPTPPKPDDGDKPTPPKPDDEGEKPTPPKPDDGGKPTPPKPDDGGKPTPPKPDDEGDKPTPPKPDEEGEKPTPPKPDDGGKPTPPKPDDGEKPTPPKPDDGEKPTPPKPDDGGKPTPPKPDDGEKPTPPKPDDGEKPTPPKPDDGEKPTPPKPDDGGKPTPPKPDDEGDKPTPPKPDDGDKPTPPKPDDEGGDKPTPPKPDDGEKPTPPKPGGGTDKPTPEPGGDEQKPKPDKGDQKHPEKPVNPNGDKPSGKDQNSHGSTGHKKGQVGSESTTATPAGNKASGTLPQTGSEETALSTLWGMLSLAAAACVKRLKGKKD
ncbi:LPXTG cell wall anchor domain-containing protein [Atopobacter sp. AH10]|uniref:LPXTG cell wall anchor domain-containing protein n=1 Tax=Atopobacter sp. AH10 TaxID=2315861 RepID=UPI000EF1F619|nr:LPXTG cell wall anchor domain-containing protein [Atopobacter sp. AH10]RLK63854.1 LPXTG cell wall anchor domain-containing protein [Atopobacter sp. AH10]